MSRPGDAPEQTADDDPVLDEILRALDMPPAGLRSWFDQLRAFCDQHGGDRHYRELTALVAQCQERLR